MSVDRETRKIKAHIHPDLNFVFKKGEITRMGGRDWEVIDVGGLESSLSGQYYRIVTLKAHTPLVRPVSYRS